jgi:hypothetical protein
VRQVIRLKAEGKEKRRKAKMAKDGNLKVSSAFVGLNLQPSVFSLIPGISR